MTLEQLTEKKERLCSYGPLSGLIGNLDEWVDFEFVDNSYALDGGTSSVVFLDKGITARGKTIEDHLELINHMRALHWVRYSLERHLALLQEKDIQNLHSLLREGIDEQNAGKYRKVNKKAYSSCMLPEPGEVFVSC